MNSTLALSYATSTDWRLHAEPRRDSSKIEKINGGKSDDDSGKPEPQHIGEHFARSRPAELPLWTRQAVVPAHLGLERPWKLNGV
jgi:hypothetical protein